MSLALQTHQAYASELAQITERLRQSTVQIRSARGASGSGVVWRPDGTIVTNAHVAGKGSAEVEFADGRRASARLLERDTERDLAVLQTDATGLPAIERGDARSLRPGHLVLAVGNPRGVAGAVTVGIVHQAFGQATRGGWNWIQSDLRLAPGNSGGPLADAEGRVVGINTMIAYGLGLAIPTHVVEAFLAPQSQPRKLGVTLQPVLLPSSHRDRLGLVVLEFEPDSPALRSGLLPGDIILGVGGKALRQPDDLRQGLREAGPRVDLDISRGGQRTSLAILLADPLQARAA